MIDVGRAGRTGLPERPSLDGLTDKWARRWQRYGTYAADGPPDLTALAAPAPIVWGEPHLGHVFWFTHADTMIRFQRMRGLSRVAPAVQHDADPAGLAAGNKVDAPAYDALSQRLGLSADWRLIVWCRLDAVGEPDHFQLLIPDESSASDESTSECLSDSTESPDAAEDADPWPPNPVVTPMDLMVQNGSDAVRYLAINGQPGPDVDFDPAQITVGWQLADTLLAVSNHVLRMGVAEALRTPVAEALDQAMLARLAEVVTTETVALTQARFIDGLRAAERFFWKDLRDYLDLVQHRAQSAGPAGQSARAALAAGISVLLRLFAPFLPFVTEEAWSWWRYGSVHHATWPTTYELSRVAPAGNSATFDLAREALRQVRCAKADRALPPTTPVPLAEVLGTAAQLDQLALWANDLRAAERIGRLDLLPGRTPELVIACAF